jgi:riboflavin kinase/FMN adenylyltransferase
MDKTHHIQGLENVGPSVRGCVLTIGNFDGVHLGHRRLVALARELADAEGVPAVAMTFEPTPDLVIRPDDPPRRVSPHTEKVQLLLEAGCDLVVTVHADRPLLHMTPNEFICDVIGKYFAPKHVVEGPNFFFGQKRAGTVETLRNTGREMDFDVHLVDPLMVKIDGKTTRVCSTLIRTLILEGCVERAAELLGRPFALTGPVIGGEQVGRMLEYPTANLAPDEQVVPADGVYAGAALLGGRRYVAAISIGPRPTFGPGPRTIEANLIDAEGDFYEQEITIRFLKRLRGQETYATSEELKTQIAIDVEQTKEIVADGK